MGVPAEALLDTSALIEVLDRKRLELMPDQPHLSESVYEYVRYKRERRFYKMRLEEAFTVLPITNEVVEVAADVFAQLKKRGTAVSENDIYIAATATAHGLPLLTRDRDYLKIGEVAPALRLYLVD